MYQCIFVAISVFVYLTIYVSIHLCVIPHIYVSMYSSINLSIFVSFNQITRTFHSTHYDNKKLPNLLWRPCYQMRISSHRGYDRNRGYMLRGVGVYRSIHPIYSIRCAIYHRDGAETSQIWHQSHFWGS